MQEIEGSPTLDPRFTNYIVSPARLSEETDSNGNTYPITDAVIAPITALPDTAFADIEPGFIDREGDKFNDVTLRINWNRNNLIQPGIFPTGGNSQQVSLEFAVPGSDMSFYRLQMFAETYIPLNNYIPFLSNEWKLHFDARFGYGDAYGGTEQLPFFRNFYAGGLRTVRGYETNTLGPRSTPPLTYRTQFTELRRDANGDPILDANGNASLDTSSERAYILEQAVDASGNPIFDASGQPVFENELFSSQLFFRDPLPFGGNIQLVGTAEILFPFGFLEGRERLRSSLFVDAGNVFSSYCTSRQVANNNCSDFSFDEMRYSAGVSISWFSGIMGIMTFSLAKPFNNSIIDESESFQFDIGTTF